VVIPAERHSQTTITTQTTGPVVTSRQHLPRNPRHGHRYPYGGVVLIFNAELGVYAVDRHPGLYFYGDHYLRRHDNRWQTASSRHGPWHPARPQQMPNRLLGVFNGGPKVAPPAPRDQRDEHDRRDDRLQRGQRVPPAQASGHLPPRNPRHGHRYPYGGVVLIFNAELGAYAVDRHPGLYFYDDHYLRRHDNRWQTASSRHGPWHPARPQQMPNRLLRVFNGGPQPASPPAPHEQRHEHDRRDDHPRHEQRQPPAPAQSQHLRHQGHELVFERGLGVYRLVDRRGVYFFDNRYLRYERGGWLVSERVNGRWRAARKGEVPRKLQQSRRDDDGRPDKANKAQEKNRLQGIWK